jgi:hypothetical protein
MGQMKELTETVRELVQVVKSRGPPPSSSPALIQMVSAVHKRQIIVASRQFIMNGGILGTSHGQQTFDCCGRWAPSSSSALGVLKNMNPALMNLLLPSANSLGFAPPAGAADVSALFVNSQFVRDGVLFLHKSG